MSDARRIRPIMKGLRPYYLEKIMHLNPLTIPEMLTHIRRVAETKMLSERPSDRQFAVMSVRQEEPIMLEMKDMVKATMKLVEEIQEERKLGNEKNVRKNVEDKKDEH
ncbi:unnamed protein product [Orchesella dallaii]|uniref:Uncharacterized protein n=1 Tax=Orchesella dallaii TaxID=48710 RepID=A0ABP1PVL0_9HEXA